MLGNQPPLVLTYHHIDFVAPLPVAAYTFQLQRQPVSYLPEDPGSQRTLRIPAGLVLPGGPSSFGHFAK